MVTIYILRYVCEIRNNPVYLPVLDFEPRSLDSGSLSLCRGVIVYFLHAIPQLHANDDSFLTCYGLLMVLSVTFKVEKIALSFFSGPP